MSKKDYAMEGKMLKSLICGWKILVKPARFSQSAWDAAQEALALTEGNPAAMRVLAAGDRKRGKLIAKRWNSDVVLVCEQRAEAIEYLAEALER